jgi:ADP-ribosylglycohydrolase
MIPRWRSRWRGPSCGPVRSRSSTTLVALGEELVAWSRSPLNNRAPSGTCIAACRNLARGLAWRDAGVKGSKGASGVTRAAPVGLALHGDDAALVRLAAAQSAITHAHPTAVSAAVGAAAAVAWAARGGDVAGLFAHCRAVVGSITPELLVGVGCTPGVVDHVGAREALEALALAESLAGKEADDPCELFGDARVGEEALACALWCVARAGGSFREAVLRGANASGASDMIACIAGAVAGAMTGRRASTPRGPRGVERADALEALAAGLAEVSVTRAPCPLDPVTDLFGRDRFALRPEDALGGEDTEVDILPEALRSLRLPTGAHAPAGRKPSCPSPQIDLSPPNPLPEHP